LNEDQWNEIIEEIAAEERLNIVLFTVGLSKYFVEKQPWLAHYFIFSKNANI
jgi:hypothetical protein